MYCDNRVLNFAQKKDMTALPYHVLICLVPRPQGGPSGLHLDHVLVIFRCYKKKKMLYFSSSIHVNEKGQSVVLCKPHVGINHNSTGLRSESLPANSLFVCLDRTIGSTAHLVQRHASPSDRCRSRQHGFPATTTCDGTKEGPDDAPCQDGSALPRG